MYEAETRSGNGGSVYIPASSSGPGFVLHMPRIKSTANKRPETAEARE
jgi:hypothetical protein